jgi:hypothetical protein
MERTEEQYREQLNAERLAQAEEYVRVFAAFITLPPNVSHMDFGFTLFYDDGVGTAIAGRVTRNE